MAVGLMAAVPLLLACVGATDCMIDVARERGAVEMAMAPKAWQLLGTDIVLRIFHLLPAACRATLRAVCRQWRRVVRAHLPVRLCFSGAEDTMLDWASSCAELRHWALRSTAKPLPPSAVDVLSVRVSRSAGLCSVALPGAFPDPSSASSLALLAALGASPSLTELRIQQNLFGLLATQTLATALSERIGARAALRVLDFSQNEPLGSAGSEDSHAFEAFCGALVDHAPRLQTLNLGSCGLQQTSAAALSILLSGRPGSGGGILPLKELSLSSNPLGAEVGLALAAAIGHARCTLKILELRRTNLGEQALLYAHTPLFDL